MELDSLTVFSGFILVDQKIELNFTFFKLYNVSVCTHQNIGECAHGDSRVNVYLGSGRSTRRFHALP